MAVRLNPNWKQEKYDEINQVLDQDIDYHIDTILSLNVAAKWLIVQLAEKNIPFKIYNLGGGVKRITTNTDTCPCCKKKLN